MCVWIVRIYICRLSLSGADVYVVCDLGALLRIGVELFNCLLIIKLCVVVK